MATTSVNGPSIAPDSIGMGSGRRAVGAMVALRRATARRLSQWLVFDG